MINVLAQGDGGTIKTGKCWKCWSNSGARWDGKMLEMLEQRRSKVGWENVGNVGAKSEQGGLGKCRSRVGWENKWYMTMLGYLIQSVSILLI